MVECDVKAVMKMYEEVLSKVKVIGENLRVCSESGHTSRVSPFAVHLCCGDREGGK